MVSFCLGQFDINAIKMFVQLTSTSAFCSKSHVKVLFKFSNISVTDTHKRSPRYEFMFTVRTGLLN